MELDSLYVLPTFVKEASEDMLQVTEPGALVVSGYRYDNPAAAWVSAASLRKQAMENPSFTPGFAVRNAINTACNLFGIGEDSFTLRSSSFDHILVKTASDYADIIIGDASDYSDAVDAVISKRANAAPYEFCKECATELLNLGSKKGYEIDDARMGKLKKIAGVCPVDFEAGIKQIKLRESLANRVGQYEAAGILSKLAKACDGGAPVEIVPHVINCLDEFDRGIEIMNKSAGAEVKRPEDAFYMNTYEVLSKKANESLVIDRESSVKRGALMGSAKVSAISKWASDCGFIMKSDAEPEEVVDTVRKMPYSIRKEFVERFA